MPGFRGVWVSIGGHRGQWAWVGVGGYRAWVPMGRYGWGQVTMGRYGGAQGSGEGRPGPIWSVQCCWSILSCAAPMLDTFGFLLDSSSQTTVLSSRRHHVGQDTLLKTGH